jgi:N-acetylmuramoyl-L-alanine amidase
MINFILDLGHGGLDDDGNYTTAPNKMFTFPNGRVIYEGVINRQIGQKVGRLLVEACQFVYYTVKPWDSRDKSLSYRTHFANAFNPSKTVFISFHSNASPQHNARGFEIWTSKGETDSDLLATCIGKRIQEDFPDIPFRADFIDGDLDKESNLWVLKKTKCVAVLLESLFFDYVLDADLLEDEDFQNKYSHSVCNGILDFVKTF